MPPGVTQPGRLSPNDNKASRLNRSPLIPGKAWGKTGTYARAAAQRDNAQKAAKKAAAAKTKPKIPTPKTKATPTPPPAVTNQTATSTALPTPEDVELNANYDPNQLHLMDNTKIAGLAGKIQLPNALNYANSMANLQYGGKIQALAGRIKGLTNALPGSLQALDAAFKNIDAARVTTVNNPQTSGQGVANLFGGNTGAAAIAANQSAQASATAANQAGQLTDEAGAANRREADWKTRIELLNNMAVNQGRSDLIGAQGERDNAKKAYYDQALKTRGDMVSQAISNQGALNNQRISTALAGGQLESQGLTNAAKALQNTSLGLDVAAKPQLLQNTINLGKQNIINSVVTRGINVATANEQLKQLKSGNKTVDTLKGALGKGGMGALQAMILPQTALVPKADQSGYNLIGNPNSYYKRGIEQIMIALPGSDRKKVAQYVSNQISQAVNSTGNKWILRNGRYVKRGTK